MPRDFVGKQDIFYLHTRTDVVHHERLAVPESVRDEPNVGSA